MSPAKYTPGPWSYRKGYYSPKWREDCFVIEGAHDEKRHYSPHVAHMVHPKDAPILAAAPDLLEWLAKAVQMAEQQAKGGDDIPLTSAWRWLSENARAAIAKATGEGRT